MNITTTYTSNGNGRSQIRATGAGRQRTVSYDQSRSPEWNHGNAAGTLALVLIEGDTARTVAARTARITRHRVEGKMRFSLGE